MAYNSHLCFSGREKFAPRDVIHVCENGNVAKRADDEEERVWDLKRAQSVKRRERERMTRHHEKLELGVFGRRRIVYVRSSDDSFDSGVDHLKEEWKPRVETSKQPHE